MYYSHHAPVYHIAGEATSDSDMRLESRVNITKIDIDIDFIAAACCKITESRVAR